MVRNGALRTLALIAFSACASASGGPGTLAEAAQDGRKCPDGPAPRTLLVVDCRGSVVPGLASWEVEGTSMVLDLEAPESAAARRLVESWPTITAPPWLGHDVRRIIAFPDNEVRVEFGGADVPVLLFADPRLAPSEFRLDPARLAEDVRDRIDDGDSSVLTRHERSIGYGRALGRDVTRVSFDRRYLVLATGGLASGLSEAVRGAVVGWWVAGGVEGARRAPAPGQSHGRCLVGQEGGPPSPPEVGSGPAQLAYLAGDPIAKQIADRLVSAALPGGALHDWFPDGLPASPHDGPGSSGAESVVHVVSVQVGSVHGCSVRGEILAHVPGLGEGVDLNRYAVPIGEIALFRIGPEEPGR